MIFKTKKETYSVREFLAGHHKTKLSPKKHNTPFFSFMGIDISSKTFMPNGSPDDVALLLVGGVGIALIGATMLERHFAANGDTLIAELISTTTNLLLPVGTFIYFTYKLFTTF
ncbi:hypothetical protein [Parageobacillus sp. G301]|uniref:hypothetical protein n=1 Tax=Parageobacillus sp. G301 TaxID=2998290 RepID=UPI002496902D|nr:hypothetical protein [Parageobacillus sp. G301]GLH62415.1 hypothetical protein PG301_02550 [Parageobacillus sp. G301]